MKIIILVALIAAAAAAPSKVPSFFGPQLPTKVEDKNLLVIGGTEAVPHSHPWQVLIQYVTSLGYQTVCSGTIVGASKIVTGGQCADIDWPIYMMSVVAGAHDYHNASEVGQQRRSLWLKVPHPEWNEDTVDYDFGVFHIVGTFNFNEYVQPLPLASIGMESSGTCKTAGWGYTEIGGPTANGLQELDVNIISRDQCSDLWGRNNFNITENMICGAGKVGQGACNGDAGNPLVCVNEHGKYLAGTTSFLHLPCASSDYPGGYSNIAAAREWIDSV